MKRKIAVNVILFVCCMTLLFTLISGCSKTDNEEETTTTTKATTTKKDTTTTTAETTEATTQETTEAMYETPYSFTMIRPPFMLESSDQATDPSSELYDERWAIVADRFNVSFSYTSVEWGNWGEKVRLNLASGTQADVTMASLGTSEYFDYIEQEAIPLLPADTETRYPDLWEMVHNVTAIDLFKYEGTLFALPRPLDPGGINVSYDFMIQLRKDILTELGFEMKDGYTLDEFYQMGMAVKENYPDMIPYASIWTNGLQNFGIEQYCIDRGFHLDEETNQYVYGAADPALVEGIKWAKKFYDEGLFDPDFLTAPDLLENRSLFSTGQIFGNIDGADLGFLNLSRNSFEENNPGTNGIDAVDVAFRLSSEGKIMEVINGNWWSEMILDPKMSEDKMDRYLTLYDWLCSEEGIEMAYYGIEGKDFERDGDRIIPQTEFPPETGGGYLLEFVAFPGVTLGLNDPFVADETKERVLHLFEKRENADDNVLRNQVDKFKRMYSSPAMDRAKLRPEDEIMRLISTVSADEIEAEWNKWVEENRSVFEPIVEELNTAYANYTD